MSTRLQKPRKTRPVLEGREIGLEDWLHALKRTDVTVWPDFAFPSDSAREEYLAGICQRSEREVKDLIRRFLVHCCTTELDMIHFKCARVDLVARVEHYRRILRREPAWEGLTWLLDLVDQSPTHVIAVIEAYISAHIQFLDRPYWFERLYDAVALIRAKFIESPSPGFEFLDLSPVRFEYLVFNLFRERGFEARLTSRTCDGGVDIRATRVDGPVNTINLVQCKFTRKTVGVRIVRELHGVIESEKVSHGSLVVSSKFSSAAKKWARQNPRLQLVDGKELATMLNETLGSSWHERIDWHSRPPKWPGELS